jgi:hypothetical protein
LKVIYIYIYKTKQNIFWFHRNYLNNWRKYYEISLQIQNWILELLAYSTCKLDKDNIFVYYNDIYIQDLPHLNEK